MDEPEKILWREVLLQALNDFSGAGAASDRQRADARAWLLDELDAEFGSFESVCSILALDAAAIRRELKTTPVDELCASIRAMHDKPRGPLAASPFDLAECIAGRWLSAPR